VCKKIKKFPSIWEKMSENRRGDFLTHTVDGGSLQADSQPK